MNTLTETTKQVFFRLLNRNLTVKDLEQWVFKHREKLEIELQANLYFDLILFDYNQKDSFSQLQDKIRPYIDTDEFNIWRTKSLLNDIIENKIDIVTAIRELCNLYYETDEKLIPITLGVCYESELDDVPIPSEYHLWDKKGLEEKLKKVNLYKDKIIRDAKELLDTLNKK